MMSRCEVYYLEHNNALITELGLEQIDTETRIRFANMSNGRYLEYANYR